jgi:hypothetical protein
MTLLVVALLAFAPAQATLPPATTDAAEVEVLAVGCVSGQTLTESSLTHNPNAGEEGLNAKRRWQLVTSAERLRRLRHEAGDRQVAVSGTVRRSELRTGTVGKTAAVGNKGRAYVGAGTPSRDLDAEAVVLPRLRVTSWTVRADTCR